MLYVIGFCIVILLVAVGLGFVIFVHELGHFVVAKLCGVKCEKFYLGFDIAGLRFCRFRWGETEYGIGILPLGGYVKMLGQEDNPARMREELERAKAMGEGPGASASDTSNHQSSINNQRSTNPQSSIPNPSLYDPRSFLAQSVPKRMAIISAGVIMNVVFAFLMAIVAFWMGVEQMPCVIGQVYPGDPAWQADLHVGDTVLQIAGKKMRQFRDLQTAISLGDIDPEKGVPMLIRRPGIEEPFTVIVKPDRSRGAFFIGVANGRTTQLALEPDTWRMEKRPPVLPGSAADLAEPKFRNGDRIVQIDDVPIKGYFQINAELAQWANQKITVGVERAMVDDRGAPTGVARRLVIPVGPNPMRTLGLVMKMGEITALQAGSPAAATEKILPGDIIRQVNGKPVTDPARLPAQLDAMIGKTVVLTLEREGSKIPLEVKMQARPPIASAWSGMPNCPAVIPSLGIAYRILNQVDNVVAGSPASRAGLAAGDVIVQARLIPPDKEVLRQLEISQPEARIPFTEEQENWPSFIGTLQETLPGTTVELTYVRQGKEQTVKLQPIDATDWFHPDRGFVFEPMTFERKADGFVDAFALGARTTLNEMTVVFRSVKKLSTNQVSLRGLGGPWTIIQMALHAADQGCAKLLLFLTLLSANLAVLNFLPIPVLDGGLMMFLIYEGIRGKPADERVQVVLTYLGLFFILALMVWVLGLDFGLIPRR